MDHQEGQASAICTELGWALQGLASILPQQADESVCLHASFIAQTPDLYKNAEAALHPTLPERERGNALEGRPTGHGYAGVKDHL